MVNPSERRRYKRFQLLDEGVVLIGAKNLLSSHVIDVSHGGIAFEYVTTGVIWPRKTITLDFIDVPLFLEAVPVKIVSDVIVQPANTENGPEIRRCGVKFILLTEAQKKGISEYLKRIDKKSLR